MKLLLSQLKPKAYNEPFVFDEEVDVSEVVSMNNDIRAIKPVRVQGDCTFDEDEIVFSLTISGEMILPCARTLVDVTHPFEIHEVEIFSSSPYYGQEEKENEIYPVEGEEINLTPCILENILLAIPFRVFSEDEEVLKQAQFEGDGWELRLESETEEQEKTIDPRLKKLQSLLEDKEKEKDKE